MENSIDLKIISPDKELLFGWVDKVELPGSAGRFMVLKGHAPLISSLEKGCIVWSCGGESGSIPVEGGFVEVAENVVTVCVE